MKRNTICFVCILLIITAAGCKKQQTGRFFASDYDAARWAQLTDRLDTLNTLSEKTLWADEVCTFLTELNKDDFLCNYLRQTAYGLADNTDDGAFKSFIYFLIGNTYKQNDKYEESLFFYDKVDPKYYSLTYDNSPIGYAIGLSVIKSAKNHQAKKKAYNILLENYKELIDVPYTQYELALLYKDELDMDTACSIMEKIIKEAPKYRYSGSNINYSVLKEEIGYYNMKKNWIYKDLDVLIKNIKYSIIRRDLPALKRCISKSQFDCIVGQKTKLISWDFSELQIQKRWHTNIVFSNELEPQSNENEAWLKTYNWGFPQLHTWYFHFKRINYPYDEKIDRGWEWQGIIFGDMF